MGSERRSALVYNRTQMLVEWDPGVSALEDEEGLTVRDPFSDEEERWVTMRLDAYGRLLERRRYEATNEA